MGRDSEIAWTDHTANFWIGCEKVAQGCRNCYAETFAKRVGADVWGAKKPRRYVKAPYALIEGVQSTAHEQAERPRVFVSSLSDFFDDGEHAIVDAMNRPLEIDAAGEIRMLYHKQVSQGRAEPLTVQHLRERAWETIARATGVDFLILTKRPEAVVANWYNGGQPLANVWLGVSAATDTEYTEAIGWLHELHPLARYTFVSAEPMVEDIRPRLDGFAKYRAPDWVIVGGESGSHARPCRVAWIRKFVQARRPGGAKLFVKQLGSNVPDFSGLKHPKGGDPEEWPQDLRVREFPERKEKR